MVLILGLASLAVVVFWPVRDAGFIHFDDDENIARNHRVASGLTPAAAAWAFRTTQTGNWQPLTWLSLMLDVQFFGLDPGRMHQVNILLHGANGVLLFALMRALTGALWRSALVAALFLVHPLHVESVAWISERKDVLSTLFWILGLGAYGWYVRRPIQLRFAPVALLMAASLMAKPMAVTFPLTLLLMDYWPLGRLRGPGAAANRLLEKAPLFALSAAAVALAIYAQDRGAALNTLEGFALPVRFGNALLSYGWYLGKTVWPTDLAFFYPHPGASLSWPLAALDALLLAGASVAVVRLRRLPYLATGWFWYVITLVPVIGIVQVGGQAKADRYSYVALTGLLLLVSWGVGELTRRRQGLRVAVAVAISCVAALAAAARVQAGHWRDSYSLSRHAARVAPSWLAFLDLGITAQLEGSSAEALVFLQRSRDLEPGNTLVWYNLGWVQERRQEWGEALEAYRRAAVLGPGDAAPPTALGVLLSALGRHSEAIPWLETAVRLAPESARAHGALGGALMRSGERRRAEAHLVEAVRLNPGNIPAHLDLAWLRLAQGRPREAVSHLAEVLKRDPAHREARALLDRAVASQGP